MFTIGDRFFRWEFPEGSSHHLKTKSASPDVKTMDDAREDIPPAGASEHAEAAALRVLA